MEQVYKMEGNSISSLECAKTEVSVEFKDIKTEPEREEEVHKVPRKNKLLKLFRKSKYNAKYMEQVIPIQRFGQKRFNRDYGIY